MDKKQIIGVMCVVAVMVFTVALSLFRQVGMHYRPPCIRNDAIRVVLEVSLNNYRAQKGEWPFRLNDLSRDPVQQNIYSVSGESNAVVFAKIFQSDEYVDRSRTMTYIDGKQMTIEKALKKGYELLPVGYIDTKTKEFLYFSVIYNSSTDIVKVRLDH